MDFGRPVQAVIPGSQGRILAVLAETTAEISLSTLARLAKVSVAQASRVMPTLVQLGLVERREVPPSSLFRLIPDNVGAQAVLALADSQSNALRQMGATAAAIRPTPLSVVVYGSFARGDADDASDIDMLVVRRDEVNEDDGVWEESISAWLRSCRSITGNAISLLEVTAREAADKLSSNSGLWTNIKREGVVVHGDTIESLTATLDA